MYSSKDWSGFGLSVWYPYGIGALSVIVTGSSTFHLFHGVCLWRSQKQSKCNNNSCWAGLCGRWCKEKRLCELSPLLTGVGNNSSEQGPSPKGTFCPSPRPSHGWKAAGCYNTGSPVCRKQVWFLLSFWLYSHLNSNQHFINLGVRQGLSCFRLGNPWGWWADPAGCHHCWPGSGSMGHCHGTLWGPPGHLGSLPRSPLAPAMWFKYSGWLANPS